MLDTRRKSMVEQRKQRKSQLNSRFSGNVVSGGQYPAGRLSGNASQWLNQQPPQYQMESDYGIDNPSFEPISLDEEYNRRVAQQNRVTFA